MFKEGSLYRHLSCLDIDMYVMTNVHTTYGHFLSVKYYNRHYGVFQPTVSSIDRDLWIDKMDEYLWKEVSL